MGGETINALLAGITNFTWQNAVMLTIAGVLIFLAIVKEYEPLLLLPIGVGAILANIPLGVILANDTGRLCKQVVDISITPDPASFQCHEPGMLSLLYQMGVGNELFPLLIFIGIGAMTDFGPLLENPKMVLLGAAGQFGIFLTLILALLFGFSQPESASIGIIGAIDGPTSIYVSGQLAPHLQGPITVVAYSYMSLVPIIMPPVMRLLTSKKERAIEMPYSQREISKRTRILFPIIVTIVVCVVVPAATPLVGSLMFGNVLRESKVVERLTQASANELANVVTLFLGLAIGSTMTGEQFLRPFTLAILLLGLVAFGLDTAFGVMFGKLMNLFTGGKFNPLIGAAGISAFPMAARVVQKEASRENYSNFILMHAMGANAAGQIASCVAGGVLLALMAG